ncbi:MULTISPECIES: SsrA-binding protein SmpB [Clostridium]|uniref:SsrA-binding protein n=1 Tax=Clostridium senegalense TaxID=1465809 RepID=A0A6M0H876_9CLOT|nr:MULTISPECIES: SsrA-binding protein SmpB [Clostridium]NEU06514.1 SsrA-binding protein SmpB [Clostridium senegalense]
MAKRVGTKTLVENRKARHDYFVEEGMEAGIVLVGTEVKSIRAGKANIKESYAEIRNGEVFIVGMHISPYEQGNIFNVDPLREKKLLLHKEQIRRLIGLLQQEGHTLIPLALYLKDGKVKVNLGVCKGKKSYDKRDSMLEKAHKREIDRQLKERSRY